MRVLGVDPGLTRCGIGVVEGTTGRPLHMVGVGVVRTPAGSDIGERLVLVERGIDAWLDEHRPECVAVERVFSQHNVRTVMGTAQASAVALLCAARRGLPVALHTPSEVKAAVTGSGRADKAQVGTMVARLLRLAEAPRPADAADALALAICHLWRAPATNRLTQAVATHRAAAPRQPAAPRTVGPGPTGARPAADSAAARSRAAGSGAAGSRAADAPTAESGTVAPGTACAAEAGVPDARGAQRAVGGHGAPDTPTVTTTNPARTTEGHAP